MGGKKKIGLKQMERMQSKKDAAEKSKVKKEKKATVVKEKRTTIGVIAPDVKNEKNISDVKKMPVLTPYSVATKFNIRISAAKEFLRQLDQIGAVQLVSGNHTIKIYKPNK